MSILPSPLTSVPMLPRRSVAMPTGSAAVGRVECRQRRLWPPPSYPGMRCSCQAGLIPVVPVNPNVSPGCTMFDMSKVTGGESAWCIPQPIVIPGRRYFGRVRRIARVDHQLRVRVPLRAEVAIEIDRCHTTESQSDFVRLSDWKSAYQRSARPDPG